MTVEEMLFLFEKYGMTVEINDGKVIRVKIFDQEVEKTKLKGGITMRCKMCGCICDALICDCCLDDMAESEEEDGTGETV